MAITFFPEGSDCPQNFAPLSTEQKKQLEPSGILPSGESNFFDFTQHHNHNNGDGINSKFPDPDSFDSSSGVLKTYAKTEFEQSESDNNIFNYTGLVNNGQFSSASQVIQIVDFNIFNPYIHLYGNIQIPYLSSYKVSSPYNPYELK